jgi:hypothetical protein
MLRTPAGSLLTLCTRRRRWSCQRLARALYLFRTHTHFASTAPTITHPSVIPGPRAHPHVHDIDLYPRVPNGTDVVIRPAKILLNWRVKR